MLTSILGMVLVLAAYGWAAWDRATDAGADAPAILITSTSDAAILVLGWLAIASQAVPYATGIALTSASLGATWAIRLYQRPDAVFTGRRFLGRRWGGWAGLLLAVLALAPAPYHVTMAAGLALLLVMFSAQIQLRMSERQQRTVGYVWSLLLAWSGAFLLYLRVLPVEVPVAAEKLSAQGAGWNFVAVTLAVLALAAGFLRNRKR